MKKIFLICLLAWGLLSGLSGFGQTAVNTKEFVKRAAEYTLNSSFTSKEVKDEEETSYYSEKGKVWVQHPGSQNRRLHQRLIPPPPASDEYLWVADNGGKPIAKTIIHLYAQSNFSLMPVIYGLIDDKRWNNATYRISEGNYQGIPCYEIAIRYSGSDAAIVQAPYQHFHTRVMSVLLEQHPEIKSQGISLNIFNENKEQLKNNYFAMLKILVDKNPEHPFIYQYAAYDAKGKSLGTRQWGKVRFLDHVPEKYMTLPAAVTVKDVKGADEYLDTYWNAYGKGEVTPPNKFWNAISCFFSGIADFFSRNMEGMLSWGGKITFWLAIAAAVLAVILKIRAKYKAKA